MKVVSPLRDKLNRFEAGSEDEEEEIEVETETEVEVTDSEAETETSVPSKTEKSEGGEKNDSSVRGDDDDVLNVDCRDEVDEFSKFLNDFESELNDPVSVS